MAFVHSTQLALGDLATAGGFVVVYTVPDGKRAILRNAYIWNAAGANLLFDVRNHAANGEYAWVLRQAPLGDGLLDKWDFWAILNEGDQLELYTSHQPLYYWINGTELSLP